MNWLGLLTMGLGFVGYSLGVYFARRPTRRGAAFLTMCAALLLAVPAMSYDVYYSKLLGEPIWLYRIRTVPGSELLASLSGFLAGWLQMRMVPHLRLSPVGKRFFVPVVFGFGLALPYLKPLLRPLRSSMLREEWK